MSESTSASALPPHLDPRGARRVPRSVPAGGASGGRRLLRALSWVAALTSLVVLLGSGGAYLYVNSKLGAIKRVGGLCLKDCKDRPAAVGRTENYLLVGSDSRAGANGTGANLGLVGQGTGGKRSDTTMLVHLSADHAKVEVVSFPRDMLVDTPKMTVPQTGAVIGGLPGKFNTAFAVGYEEGRAIPGTRAVKEASGDQLAAAMVTKQVEDVTGLPVDHYVEVDFAGFQQIVDAVGGVPVCLSVDANDPGGDGSGGSGFHHKAGHFTLDGQTALQFVRQRHGLPGEDLGRIGRQQRFLAALTRKVKSAGTLLNPVKLDHFVSAVTSHVYIDDQTTQGDLLTLATRLRNLDPSRVAFSTVPLSGDDTKADSIGYRSYIDKPKADALFAAIRADRDPGSPAPAAGPAAPARPATALTVPASAVALTVENGSGITGQASRAAADLRALGFPVTVSTGGPHVDATTIRYGSGRKESAQTLAAAVPGATLQASDALGEQALLLLTGSDYTGAQAVSVGGAASPAARPVPSSRPAAPRPAGSPSPSAATAASNDCGP